MKYIIVLFYFFSLFIPNNTIAQKETILSVKSVQNTEKENLNISNLIKKINAQEKEIDKLKIDKNYYQSNLSEQTTIFSTITALFALLLGFITYKGINWELKQQKKYFKSSLIELENKTTELQKIITDYNNKHHYETGNLNMLISIYHKDDFVTKFIYSLRSANEFSKCGDENYVETLRTLITSNINLNKITKEKTTESFFKNSDKILSELIKIPNSKITSITAEIIVKINVLKQPD